ncbi:hypothetical protein OQA88_12117 [Cercophora sp. LCS_1]
MSSFGLGKVMNSAVSAVNENTLALVNINFDFSLWRCSPAPEFHPVGSALTVGRRKEAETGQTHRTACKLGFLFHEEIPDTPKLIKAYGHRVSEILSSPDINPHGTVRDGPFQDFIGADCTTIWAAATSGNSAIAVHLLACMLANAWDTKTATSIWVELVDVRKKHVLADVELGKLVNPHTHAAAQQEYSRAELASWDASARSWLRRAEASMRFRHTQLALITDNLVVPYPSGASTYETVTLTWTRAMEVLERLLNNLPQQACDRAVIRGISSWHLYPDLLVFQAEATKVPFGDRLFPSTAILSLGLEYKGKASDNFTRWSLALSHLKFYGDPVMVRSNEQLNRVSSSQLWLVALGTIFRQWDIPYASFDAALSWFEELGNKLKEADGSTSQLSWLLGLCSAATGLVGERRKVADMLIKYGWRRGTRFLGGKNHQGRDVSFFGLNSPAIMQALRRSTDIDPGVEYLRQLAALLHLEACDAVISHSKVVAGYNYSEYATVSPVEEHLAMRGGNAVVPSPEKRQVRWIHAGISNHHHNRPTNEAELKAHLDRRRREIEASGEICIVVTDREYMLDREPSFSSEQGRHRVWNRPPNLFAGETPPRFRSLLGPWSLSTKYFHILVRQEKYEESKQNIPSQLGAAKQQVMVENAVAWLRDVSSGKILRYILACMRATPIDTVRKTTNNLKRKRSTTTLQPNQTQGPNTSGIDEDSWDCFAMISSFSRPNVNWLLSLQALELVDAVYASLPHATVSLQVVEQDLLAARWLPSSLRDDLKIEESASDSFFKRRYRSCAEHMESMTRAELFACVAMFESGRFNVDPAQLTEVIALCSEDSIFVAEILLSDPSVQTQKLGLRHLVGNVGHVGMVLLVSPEEPRVRKVGFDASMVSHAPYTGTVADRFGGTSLHLSFTTWKFPLDAGSHTGDIDQEIFLLEAVVSVQDKGSWVADIDVLSIERDALDIVSCSCTRLAGSESAASLENAVSIDSWEEFLDGPPCIGVLLTKDNWVARLAAVSLLAQQGSGHTAVILKEGEQKLCWTCLVESYSDPEPHMPERIVL